MSDATPTHIANRALDILGRGPTGNIENPKSPLEQRLKERYADAVRMMLRLDRWPAALKVDELPGSSLERDRYLFLIQLPADCVVVWRVWGPSEIPARLETRSYGLYYEDDDYHGRYSWERRNAQGAGAIACNFTPPVTVEYARNLAPQEMTEEMREVAGAILADLVKHHAALNTSRRQEIAAMKREAIIMATRISGSEDGPDRPFHSPWLDSMWSQ